ncbi:MAG: family 78 glycoside hydrolase catalytic domain [bacterium]|jgi:hypothetical protein|nr:family 78 glycoside hydrolase catalytic domain [bacterium]
MKELCLRAGWLIPLVMGCLLWGGVSYAVEPVPLGATPLDLHQPQHQVDWTARWIQDPLFDNQPFRYLYRKDKAEDVSGVTDTDLKNIHSLFRKTVELPQKEILSAKLYLTADDVYKLYIDGTFIGMGPSPGYLFAYPYNGWDVSKFLQSGQSHCLAVHTYYQGLVNRVWGSGDHLAGLLFQLEILYKDGSRQTIGSDETWRFYRSEAYPSNRTFGYKTQFAEDLDLRAMMPDWITPAFDDSAWGAPLVRGNPVPPQYTLVPQETPPLALERVAPRQVIQTGEGRYFIDFGQEITGSTVFLVSGPTDHVVEIRHGEELLNENEVRYDMRAGCNYQEFITLAGRPDDRIEFFDYKGFRYVEVLHWPELLTPDRVWVLNRHYPFPEEACTFTSSDDLLNRIWAICRQAVKQGTQDTYLDCPTREKGGYLGDAYVTGQSHLTLTGDARILKKTLRDFAHTARICPGLLAVAPGNFMQEIADYSLLWPIILDRYYMFSGDLAFVEEMIPVLDGLLAWFARYENAEGLLEAVPEKWNLVDWPANLRDDYDYNRAVAGMNTVLNLFYHGCLESSSRLYAWAGQADVAQALQEKKRQVKAAAQRHLVDPQTGLFVDAAGSAHSSLHANALSPMFHLAPPGGYEPVLDFLAKKRMACGVYFAAFLLEGLYNAGDAELAYDLITSKDIHSWNTMLKAGATACLEAWGPDQKWNTSWCHPWASCPIFLTANEVMGLKPAAPGWDEIHFFPKPPRGLDEAQMTIPTPKGPVTVKMKQAGLTLGYSLTVPPGSKARVSIQEKVTSIKVNDEVYDAVTLEAHAQGSRYDVPGLLYPGEHLLWITRAE